MAEIRIVCRMPNSDGEVEFIAESPITFSREFLRFTYDGTNKIIHIKYIKRIEAFTI